MELHLKKARVLEKDIHAKIKMDFPTLEGCPISKEGFTVLEKM